MAKTSLEMKKLVEEFIKITNVKYEDQTEKIKEKSDLVDWQFHVGTNVVISKNPSFSKTIMEISEICTICNIGHQWIKSGEAIAGLAIFSHIDEQNLDRVSFHNVWDNVARVAGHTQKILRSNFSNFSSKNNIVDETMSKSMYG